MNYLLLKYLFVFYFICTALNLFSQDKGRVLMQGIIECETGNSAGVLIEAYEKNTLVQRSKPTKNGEYFITLPINSLFSVKFIKQGFITQVFNVSTKVPRSIIPKSYQIINHVGLEKAGQDDGGESYIGKYKLVQTPDSSYFDFTIDDEHITDYTDIFAPIEDGDGKQASKSERPLTSEEELIENLLENGIAQSYPEKNNNEKQLYAQEIEQYKNALEKLKNRTVDDSIKLNQKSLKLKQELLDKAKTSLKLQKLNARTKKDSELIMERERLISLFEKEVKKANRENELNKYIIKAQRRYIISYVIIVLIMIGLLVFLYWMYKTKKRFSNSLKIKNFELEESQNKLRDSYEELSRQNEEIHFQKEEIEYQNVQIRDSIFYAKRLQDALLPDINKLTSFFDDAFIIFKPKDIVSGDFFWMEKVHDKVYLAVIDCTGHGVPGAFMSIVGNRMLNEIIYEQKSFEPKDMLEYLNIKVKDVFHQEETDNNDGMDISLCRFESIDDDEMRMTFCGAKRPIFYYDCEENEAENVKGNRKPIGGIYYQELEYQQEDFIIQKGDIVYLFSDGLPDQNAPNGKKIGTKRFFSIFKEIVDLPVRTQCKQLEQILHDHQQDEEQRDDITVIGIKI